MAERRENNFNFIRLMAALFVMLGHMGPILGVEAPKLGGQAIHTIGVKVLFLIGGYLITQSWERDPHPGRYALRRFFRFYPPYAVMVLLMAFVAGPLLTNLGLPAYFQSWYSSYLWNLRFFIVYAIPGVFEELPRPSVMNGSIWTMPVEALLYILIPLILFAIRSAKKEKSSFIAMCGISALACVYDLWLYLAREGQQLVFYATDWNYSMHLAVYFLIGSLFTWPQMKRFLNLQVGIAAMIAMICVQMAGSAWNELISYIAMPLFVLSFAQMEKPLFAKLARKYELSYGIYLYGFFFQQLVVKWRIDSGAGWGFYTCFAMSLALTLVAAFLSCILVEKPCLALCKKLTTRHHS